MNERIMIKTESDNGVHSITGYVDGKEVINASNKVCQSWGIGSSSTLPYDFILALLYIEVASQVMNHAKGLMSFSRGVRVQVNSSAGFSRGSKGTIEFVEPNGVRIWVTRDMSNSQAYFHPSELDII